LKVYENKLLKRKIKRHKEAEIIDISGNYVTINFTMYTADDTSSVR
jgi:hypothetical protein